MPKLLSLFFCLALIASTALGAEDVIQRQSETAEQPAPASNGEPATSEPPTDSPAKDKVEESNAGAAQPVALDPIVARIDMTLKLKEAVIDTIAKGDLLTVVSEREKDYVILTFNGKKGAVSKSNAAKLSESLPIYDELILVSPEDGRLYTMRASAHWAMGDATKALEDYNKAIELGYAVSHAYSSRGLFHSAMGESEKALDDFTKAIELDSKDEVSFMNRASVYMALGQYAKASDDYSAAIEIRKENPILYSQRAVAFKLQGKLEQAIADYDKSIELVDKDISAWMGRGFVKFQLGQFQSAVDDFSRVIELAPQSAVAFNNRGFNYQQLKKYKSALDDYRRAVELAPSYILALQNRAWLLTTCEQEDLRDPAAAIELAKTVNEISEYKDINDLTLLAAAFAAASDFETAVGWQEKAIAIADQAQKPLAEKILLLYQDKKAIDPSLLEQALTEDQENPAADAKDDSSPNTTETSETNSPESTDASTATSPVEDAKPAP